MANQSNRRAPKRVLNKEEAVRHLIHAAIRMVMSEEDPFATHLLIQSAEKILGDLSKKRGITLSLDWEPLIRPEKHQVFFNRYREAYNYFKHADRDFDQELPVHDITMMNVFGLLPCVSGFRELFGYTTGHMQFITSFTMLIAPGVFIFSQEQERAFQKGAKEIEDMSPREFFELAPNVEWIKSLGMEEERFEDTKDHAKFYRSTFLELSARDSEKFSTKDR